MHLSRNSRDFTIFKGFGKKFYETISLGSENNIKIADFLDILDSEKIVANRYGKIRHFYKFLVKFLLLMSLFIRNKRRGER
jgi:hypothetical protein